MWAQADPDRHGTTHSCFLGASCRYRYLQTSDLPEASADYCQAAHSRVSSCNDVLQPVPVLARYAFGDPQRSASHRAQYVGEPLETTDRVNASSHV
jgi:hypothetical protein